MSRALAPRTPALRPVAALAGLLLVTACGGDSPTNPGLDLDGSEAVSLPGGSSLVFQSPSAFGDNRSRIEALVRETLADASRLIPLANITVIARLGTQNVIPELGFGGRADAGTIFLTFDRNPAAWSASIDTQLLPLLAHEMHHVARLRAVGFADHLLDAMVLEGLADRFSMEVAGTPPPIWAVALTPAQLETFGEQARAEYFDTGYDHNAWFFGTSSSIPRWAGYSIGFVITGEYLAADPSRTASALYAEPSASFVP